MWSKRAPRLPATILIVCCLYLYSAVAQNFPREHYGPPDVMLAPMKSIDAFANLPWPIYNDIRGIRVATDRNTLAHFLEDGEPVPSKKATWLRAWKVPFTIPPMVRKRYPGLAKLEATGDPTLYTVSCSGVESPDGKQIYFWEMVNDQYLYLSNSASDCLMHSKRPVRAEVPKQNEIANCSISNGIPRVVVGVAEEPEWMRLDTWSSPRLPLDGVRKLFVNGHYYPFPLLKTSKNMSGLSDLRLVELLKGVHAEAMRPKVREQFEKVMRRDDIVVETKIQRGVLLQPDGCFVFWRSLAPSILEVRTSSGAVGIILADDVE